MRILEPSEFPEEAEHWFSFEWLKIRFCRPHRGILHLGMSRLAPSRPAPPGLTIS